MIDSLIWEDIFGFITLDYHNMILLMDKITTLIRELLQKQPEIPLAIIYGSAAEKRQAPESDLDLAVASKKSLSAELKMKLIENLAVITGRPVDLVNLQTTHGPLLKQIRTKGTLILKKDTTLYADIIKRMLFEDADFMPYYNRILKERRDKWINN